MIKVYQTRVMGNGRKVNQPTIIIDDPNTAIMVMMRIVRTELHYGGKVVGVSDSSVEIETSYLGILDKSIFIGPIKEMRPLCQILHLYNEAGNRLVGLVEEIVANVSSESEETEEIPIFARRAAARLAECQLKVAVMLDAGIEDRDEIRASLGSRLEDLVAALQLSAEGHCTFREALTV